MNWRELAPARCITGGMNNTRGQPITMLPLCWHRAGKHWHMRGAGRINTASDVVPVCSARPANAQRDTNPRRGVICRLLMTHRLRVDIYYSLYDTIEDKCVPSYLH